MNVIKTISLSLLFLSTSVSAKLIQIIHTNDLHSYFDGVRSGKGGYARIKTVVDGLKAEAKKTNIPSLYLDAGDFGEGSSFYFSNEGVDSLRALDLLGVDVTVLGNHDFILGGTELSRQLKKADLRATILSANLDGKKRMGLQDLMPAYRDFTFDGLKLRVFGLTTSEIHFQYPLRPLGKILEPHKVGIKMAEQAQKDGVNFLIALTHTGIDKDMELIKNTHSIGLVVGGHDHVRLGQPKMVENLDKREIPIVQTGANTLAVGALILDVKEDGTSTVVDYALHTITPDIPKNPELEHFVAEAQTNREAYFGRDWNEVIGSSEIVLNGDFEGTLRNNRSCWSRHIARLTREVAKTQIGLQFDMFQGAEIKPGHITYGDMVDNFPHFRTWGDMGWKIARATVNGFALKEALKYLSSESSGFDVTVDGLQALDPKTRTLVPYLTQQHQADMARLDGQPIHNLQYYSISLPSEVTYGFTKMSFWVTHILFLNLKYLEDGYYWKHLEDYIRKNSPLRCLED